MSEIKYSAAKQRNIHFATAFNDTTLMTVNCCRAEWSRAVYSYARCRIYKCRAVELPSHFRGLACRKPHGYKPYVSIVNP